MSKYGNIIILIGLIIIVLGILIRFTPLAKYIGKLPGDIRVEKENFRFYFPITTLILLSIIINLLIRIFKK
jgi:cytochrome c biogenesis protein ResB